MVRPTSRHARSVDPERLDGTGVAGIGPAANERSGGVPDVDDVDARRSSDDARLRDSEPRMTRAIVGWSLRFRVLVVGLAAGLMLFGVVQLPKAPVDVVPDFGPTYVEVQTEALGLSATEVEQLITVPLEADLLQGVAFLDSIESESVEGLSSIVMKFEPGTDLFQARQVVAERLTQAHALPNVSKPPLMLQPLASTSRVQMVSMTSSEVSLIDMSILARWTVRPRLLGVPGVANVAIWGLRERQLQVLIDPNQLRDQRVSIQHVLETAGNAMWVSPLTFLDASTPGTGGFIDTPNQRLGVQHVFPIRSAADLAEVPIAPEDTGGRIVRLGDVSTIVEDHQPLIGDAIVGGAGDGLLLVIEKFPGADTRAVSAGVEKALAALQPGLTGIQVDANVFRPATYIDSAVGNVSLAALAGLLLAVIALMALFRNWRSVLIALLTIPLSLAAAASVLYLLGATITAVTVAGLILAIGLVIDEVIVGVDAVARRLRTPHEGDAGRSRVDIVLAATIEGRGSLAFGTLAAVALVVPLFFATGVAGAFVPGFAGAYLLALGAAIVVALTVVPALGSLLTEAGGPVAEAPAPVAADGAPSPANAGSPSRLARAYDRALGQVLARTRPSVLTGAAVVVGVIAIAGSVAMPAISGSLLPSFRERQLLITWDAAPGTSRPEMDRVMTRVSEELRAVDGVSNVGAHIGRAIVSDQVVSVNSGEIWVTIGSAADYDRTVDAIETVIAGYPGIDRTLVTYSDQRVAQVLSGSQDDVVVRVYGQDLDELRAKAGEVRDAVATIGGVSRAVVDEPALEPSIEIEVKLDKAQGYGIKAGDVRRAAAVLLSGIEVGSIFQDQKIFSVVVWGKPETRRSLTTIQDLPVQAPGGAFVRLGDVADVRIADSPAVIRREGVFRRVDVAIDVDGRDLAAVTSEIDRRVAGIEFPLEYHAEVRTLAADRSTDFMALLAVAAGAAIFAFLLLQAAFGRWRLAILLFIALPSVLIGSLIGSLLAGGASLGTVLGGLGVLALAIRQAVALFDRSRRLENDGEGDFGPALVAQAARDRLIPIVATALATILALAPAIVIGDVAGLELIRPMAITVIGGLVTSTLFVLLISPSIYLFAGPGGLPDPATGLLDRPAVSVA